MDERIESVVNNEWKEEEEEDDGGCFFIISTEPDEEFHIDRSPPSQHLYAYLSLSSSSSHFSDDISPLPILGGTNTPLLPLSTTPSKRNCWNCSSPHHSAQSCPLPRDTTLITLNRQAYQTDNPITPGRGIRLGGGDDQDERIRMRQFVELYRPGVVSGELRKALGCTAGEEYPWFVKMRTVGYPPGFVWYEGETREVLLVPVVLFSTLSNGSWSFFLDPLEIAKDRIGRDLNWSDVDLLAIYDEPETAPLNPIPPLPSHLPPPPPSDPPPPPGQLRVVHYTTALFNSDTLPVYIPDRLRYSLARFVPSSIIDPLERRMEEEVEDGEVDMDISEEEM